MTIRSNELRERRAALRRQLQSTEAELEQIERFCQHDWELAVYKPIQRPGGHVEAVHAGSDSTPAFDYPPETLPRWRRTCRKCGRIEETERIEEEVTKKPRW
jgi:hypothetical protein